MWRKGLVLTDKFSGQRSLGVLVDDSPQISSACSAEYGAESAVDQVRWS